MKESMSVTQRSVCLHTLLRAVACELQQGAEFPQEQTAFRHLCGQIQKKEKKPDTEYKTRLW